MPQYKQNTKQFVISVATTGGGQYKATVPKRLMDSLGEDGVTEIVGRFSLQENSLTLNEEYRVVTIDCLLRKWWNTNIPLAQQNEDDLRVLDWDETLTAIGVQVRDYQGRKIVIGDIDRKDTYGTETIWVAFIEE